MKQFWLILPLILLIAGPARAQEEDRSSNGYIVQLLEDSLSSEDMTIRFDGIDGLLASDARVGRITIADREGVWLTLENVALIWSRLALLGGAVEVERLDAARIELARLPAPSPSALPSPEAKPFEIPDLPVSVNIGQITADVIALGAPVIGQAAALRLDGRMTLDDGKLDAAVDLERLDGPGGTVKIVAAYAPGGADVALTLRVEEPGGGLLSNVISLPDDPGILLEIDGAGPLDELAVGVLLATDGKRRAGGQVLLNGLQSGGLGFDAQINGDLAPLLSADARPFFAGRSEIAATGQRADDGHFALETLRVATSMLDLQGSATTRPDGFLDKLRLTGTLDAGDAPVLLPGGGAELDKASLNLDFGHRAQGAWGGEITVVDLRAGDVHSRKVSLTIDGTSERLDDPQGRKIAATIRGGAFALGAEDADLARALGPEITLDVAFDWAAGNPVAIRKARLSGQAIAVDVTGDLTGLTFDGRAALDIARLTPFAGLAGRPLGGAARLDLRGAVTGATGGFDLALDGTAQDLRFGMTQLDPLLRGETRLSGRIARDAQGVRTEDLELENAQLRFSSDGGFSSQGADMRIDARLADLALILDGAQGPVTVTGRAEGGGDVPVRLRTRIRVPEGRLLERDLDALVAGFTGQYQAGALTGNLMGQGRFGSADLRLAGAIGVTDAMQRIDGLRLSLGGADLRGDISRDAAGLLRGALRLDAQDISQLAALALQKASGAVRARITLDVEDAGQSIVLWGGTEALAWNDMALGRAEIEAQIMDAFGVPGVTGLFAFETLKVGGLVFPDGQGGAAMSGATTDFAVETRLDNGAALDLSGALTRKEEGFLLRLSRLDMGRDAEQIRLRDEALLWIDGAGGIVDARLLLEIGSGTALLGGHTAPDLDLHADLDAVPLGIINGFVDGIGAEGLLDGALRLTGALDDPHIDAQLDVTGAATQLSRDADLPPLGLTATAQGGPKTGLSVAAKLSGPQNFALTAAGTVPLDAEGALAFGGQLDRFPLVLLDRIAGRSGLAGRINGNFGLSGTFAQPRVRFEADAAALGARALRENGVPPLNVGLSGSFFNNRLVIGEGQLTGGGIGARFSGRVPLEGPGLAIALNGSLPLGLSQVALADVGVGLTGNANVSLRADGRLIAPDLSGSLAISDGTLVMPEVNLRLNDLRGRATFAGQNMRIEELAAHNAQGGQLALSGLIELDPAADFPADLRLDGREMRYTDGQIATVDFAAQLALKGPLARKPDLSGQLDIARAEIAIPDASGVSGPADFVLDLRHKNISAPIALTLERAGYDGRTGRKPPQSPVQLLLDLLIEAPQRVFVRGRGLDAELGGRIHIRGTDEDPKPEGRLGLIRGRMQLLGQRLTLTEGEAQFTGALEAFLRLAAETETDNGLATIAVEGPISAPVLKLSSVPPRPDDEILADILFSRALSDLSPLQLARLASAVAELAGQSGASVFEQIRRATGLSDLDFRTNDDGTTAVSAGAYLSEDLYSSVEADSAGGSKINLNLDLTRELTARGALDSLGNSSVGLYFERDY